MLIFESNLILKCVKTMYNLDDFDIQILKQLEIDGRMAYSVIASTLNISNTIIHRDHEHNNNKGYK